MRNQPILRTVILAFGTIAAGRAVAQEKDAVQPLPHRVFASSRFSVDEILARPYDVDVPMGSVGDRVWASSPQGWAFRDDVHWLYLTNLKAFDLEIRDEHGLLQPAKATYYPSHVHLEGATRAVTASASFTFTTDNVQNPLTKPLRPEKRWTCWSSGKREDWYAVDFGAKRQVAGLKIFFFDDAPSGGCRPPEQFEVQRWSGSEWASVPLTKRQPEKPSKGENSVEFEPIATDRVRLVFRNAGENFYTGLYGFEPVAASDPAAAEQRSPDSLLEFSGDKFITADDVLVATVRVRNTGRTAAALRVRVASPAVYADDGRGIIAVFDQGGGMFRMEAPPRAAKLHETDVTYRLAAALGPSESFRVEKTPGGPTVHIDASAGQTIAFTCTLAIGTIEDHATAAQRRWTATDGGLSRQLAEYQAWFDANVAYFDCSDPWVTKMYYHRAYNLRKNTLDPKLGRMQWKTQAEGRWRSGWYPNVISYGGGHQVREARWLRDKSYAQGHLRTFAENQKADGVYPSHVKPAGPQGGQYTDWITSSAWDAHLVHPDREFLAAVADKLADNARGWQKVYDLDGDGLLLVDSHWWTGMEYQPSFFYFSDYKPAKNFHEPENKVSLDRVDLTAYNFGNAVAVARIYREVGQPDKAREFDDLAAKIAAAVRAKMWDKTERFFYSLKHGDGAKADVKEVIGVYPFYFGMLPLGSPERYEAAWQSILDPEQFWTPWPVASASKKCPAYSQTNWPGDGRAAGCMWNGPTWPHANSIVMTAMARTLREGRASSLKSRKPIENRRLKIENAPTTHRSPLTADHLWDLYYSFTKAQYRDQDPTYPWTGEFYHGETGNWKTAERDYNHSTWLDILIPEILGLVPRADDVLEIDPLVPPEKLTHFLLDGQHYRGHDVTVVWDQPGRDDHYGDGRTGLDVYLDGKLVASSEKPDRLMVDLRTGRRLPTE
jgi:hypothetical protein